MWGGTYVLGTYFPTVHVKYFIIYAIILSSADAFVKVYLPEGYPKFWVVGVRWKVPLALVFLQSLGWFCVWEELVFLQTFRWLRRLSGKARYAAE